MDIYAFGPIAAVLDGAYAVFVSIATVIEPLAGSSSAALAVVVFTLLVRALLIPVGVSQARADRVRQRLAPAIAELRRRHSATPEHLQRKILELYAAEKASPAAGCLPVLAQAPVLSIVYGVFLLPSIGGHPNMLLTENLLGVPLGSALAHAAVTGTLTWGTSWPVLVIVAGIAAIAQISRKLLNTTPLGADPRPAGDRPEQTAILRAASFAPFMTAVVATLVPLAAALYLLVTVTWTLGERLVLRRMFR
jgi:YidC/Oxa1 family membrane protein insertase